MRAIGLNVHGGPEVLQVIDLPEVHAGPGEVRVQVHAARVNLVDTLTRHGSRAEQQRATRRRRRDRGERHHRHRD